MVKYLIRNALILCCLVLLGFCCVAQEKKYPPARPLGFVLPDEYEKAEIPFEIYNNLIVIDVMLNRSLPLKFVLDTGVRTTVLTEKTLSDLLNLEYSRKITIPGVGGEKLVDAYVVNDVSLNIGAIEGTGHALLVLERDLLQLKNFLGVNVHGILGYELFSRFVVDINYDRKIIELYRPDDFHRKARFVSLDISIEDTKPYINGGVLIRKEKGLVDGRFMIDTGASHALLLDTRSNDAIKIPTPSISTTLGRGLGGNIHGKVGRVDKFIFEGFDFNGVITTFPDPSSYDVYYEDEYRNGTIGGGIMTRFHVIFDYANSKLYLKKSRRYRDPFEFNISGLIIKATGVYLRQFEIDFVRKNSSADKAGLKVGDKITVINGVSTVKYSLEELIGKLNDKENKRIRLTVLRNEQPMQFDFRLHRLI